MICWFLQPFNLQRSPKLDDEQCVLPLVPNPLGECGPSIQASGLELSLPNGYGKATYPQFKGELSITPQPACSSKLQLWMMLTSLKLVSNLIHSDSLYHYLDKFVSNHLILIPQVVLLFVYPTSLCLFHFTMHLYPNLALD